MCHLQHKLIGFYNRDEKCLLRYKAVFHLSLNIYTERVGLLRETTDCITISSLYSSLHVDVFAVGYVVTATTNVDVMPSCARGPDRVHVILCIG
jgi:hypothetical protein